ncbi:MAG: exo-alpha-sialidase [Planctomycetes bacterium B3_Pla]|nr:MAG: exo-alpha-sialidase [Planctomycetes bacterium B3_Pla]
MNNRKRAILFFALVQTLLVSAAVSGEPFMQKTDLFEAGSDGYATYRIPGIVVTSRGTLLAYCEARKSLQGDWGTIDIMMRRSTDGGKTWGKQQKIVNVEGRVAQNPVALKQNLAKEGEITINNPVAIPDRQTNAVHFLYCVEYARCYYMRSDDDGRSFTVPVDITETFEKFRDEYDWKVLATGPGHGIQLRNGRLLVPVWLSTGTGGHAHRPSCVSVIYSDDNGKTWRGGQIVVAHPNPVNPSETVAVQLNDGRVMFNIRHESKPRLRGVCISPDGVTGWSKMIFHEQLPEPVCMGSIIRLSEKPAHKKNRILFANPHNPDDRRRKNVTVKLSYDEGKTWPVAKSIEPGISGYSDLAVSPDGLAYCFYERGSVDDSHYRPAHLTVTRFNLEWLTDGGDRFE